MLKWSYQKGILSSTLQPYLKTRITNSLLRVVTTAINQAVRRDLAGFLYRPSPIEHFGSKELRSYIITRVLVIEADWL